MLVSSFVLLVILIVHIIIIIIIIVKLDVPYLEETGESAESHEPSGLFLLQQAHQRYPTLPPLGPRWPRRQEYWWGAVCHHG